MQGRSIAATLIAVILLLLSILEPALALTPRLQSLRMSTSTSVRVTTYNVLSSHLARSDYFAYCNPKLLQATYRLTKVKEKMEGEIAKKSIICLQEVSTLWAGSLHSFFATRGYHFITALYGNKFNGYMGVGVAVPLSEYEIVDTDITRIADTKKITRTPKETGIKAIFNSLIYFPLLKFIKAMGWWKQPKSVWDEASDRFNQMILVRLRKRSQAASQSLITSSSSSSSSASSAAAVTSATGEEVNTAATFVVGTYHMPCIFRVPKIMSIHCALSAQHIHRFAAGSPYVYCGDFNIKPDSAMYALLRDGNIEGKEENPDVPALDSWKPHVTPLKSAYMTHNGREPDYTNNAHIVNDQPFIETLDYIFTSSSHDWRVEGVAPLGSKSDVKGPFPAEEEPSDHVLLAADLQVPL